MLKIRCLFLLISHSAYRFLGIISNVHQSFSCDVKNVEYLHIFNK